MSTINRPILVRQTQKSRLIAVVIYFANLEDVAEAERISDANLRSQRLDDAEFTWILRIDPSSWTYMEWYDSEDAISNATSYGAKPPEMVRSAALELAKRLIAIGENDSPDGVWLPIPFGGSNDDRERLGAKIRRQGGGDGL
jgi:hypothetical protein